MTPSFSVFALFALFVAIPIRTVSAAELLTLHVSPTGSDTADGRSPATAFATLERARDELRRLRAASVIPSPATIELHPGVYLRTASFELTAADSGTSSTPVTYRSASPRDPARLVVGRAVSLANFRRPTNPALLARLDPTALRPDSEAFRRIPGFQTIPSEKIGLQPDAYRPVVTPRPAFKGTPPPPAIQPDQDRNFGT